MKFWIGACLILLGTLLGQLWLRELRTRAQRTLAENPALPGDLMRHEFRTLDGDRIPYPNRCWHAYIASVACGACADLAAEWIRTPDRASAFWVFPISESGRVSEFAQEHRIARDSIRLLPVESLAEAGFFATPTLVAGEGPTIRHLTIALSLVRRNAAAGACRPGPSRP